MSPGLQRTGSTARSAATSARDDRRRGEWLAEVDQPLASSLDLELTLARVARLALSGLADWCLIDVLEDGTHHVTMAHADPAHVRDPCARWQPALGAAAGIPRALCTGRPEIRDDIPDAALDAPPAEGPLGMAPPPDQPTLVRSLGLRASMVVPLVARGRVLGAIAFASATDPRRYGPRELALAEELAQRCAVALDNARLYRETQLAEAQARRYAARVEELAAASEAFGAAGLDLPAVLDAVVRRVVDAIGDGCTIRLLSEDRLWLEPVAFHHRDPDARAVLRDLFGGPPHRVGEGLAGQVAETGQAELVPQVTPDAARALLKREHWSYLERFPIHSIMVAPLRVGGRVIGTVSLYRDEAPGDYTLDDKAFLQDLANRAAQAVENARLYCTAQEAIRARDEFLSIASHELKTPLTAALLRLQVLKRMLGPDASPQVLGTVDGVQRQQERIANLVNELLDVARIRAGRMELQPCEGVDLAEITREAAERLQGDAARSGSVVTVRADARVCGRWDRSRLEQVATNLLSNAVKYGDRQPIEVDVEAVDGGATARLRVRDHGIGIAPENHARIFERFERAASAKQFAGLGLGLYIVRQIVAAHGGTVSVASAPGKGSTFTVELPTRGA